MSEFRKQANEAIRSAHGRLTPQRRLVIETLEASEGELDVEALYHLAHSKDSSLSIATVYRTLNILEDVRLVQQHYHSRDHERRYYERISRKPAYHFKCRACHQVIAFHSEQVQELEHVLAAELGLTIFSVCLCIDGLCPNCRDKGNKYPIGLLDQFTTD